MEQTINGKLANTDRKSIYSMALQN